MRLVTWAGSHPGRKRNRNEDSYLVDPAVGVLAVADGMGGHQGGATASKMAVELLGRELTEAHGDFESANRRSDLIEVRTTEEMPAVRFDGPAGYEEELPPTAPLRPGAGAASAFSPVLDFMRRVARRASSAIYEASWQKPELRGMGTTLTAVLIDGAKAHMLHAGDSRCYLFRDGKLRQLSEDHSWIAEQVKSGALSEAEAKQSKYRHVITKSIGFERDIDVDVRSVALTAGDCLVLCSDGMSNYVEHGELERICATTWFRMLPEVLIGLANERGGDDNITVVVGMIAGA